VVTVTPSRSARASSPAKSFGYLFGYSLQGSSLCTRTAVWPRATSHEVRVRTVHGEVIRGQRTLIVTHCHHRGHPSAGGLQPVTDPQIPCVNEGVLGHVEVRVVLSARNGEPPLPASIVRSVKSVSVKVTCV
jgi:hypothetical protein